MEISEVQKLSIKKHSEMDEKWIQQQIADNPSIIGLGDLILKDKERIQPKAGRLDLLLQDPETYRRYEVEIQLGRTDESHIVRTIEYWDIEKKRYPQYDHCAVIIAEDMTSRFLNIIQLFNGHIPLIAIQMNAYRIGDKTGLVFTKVIDELKFGLIDEDEETAEITDRNYWEAKGTKETVKMADDVLSIIKEFDGDFDIKYNKYYIGLTKNGRPNNFAYFRAKKNNLRIEIKLEQSNEIEDLLENSQIDVMDYDRRTNHYRIRVTKKDLQEHRDIIKLILKESYDNWKL